LLDLTVQVLQFETNAAPSVPVALRYDTAWDVPQVFPVTCAPLANGNASIGTGYTYLFEDVTCVTPGGHIAAVTIDDAAGGPDILTQTVNDRRMPFGCWSSGRCTLDGVRVYVLNKETLDAWKTQIRGVDWSTHGLVAVTFRDTNGVGVSGVTVRTRGIFDDSPTNAIPGGEVFFLSEDRRTVVPGQDKTGSSGVALLLVTAGLSTRMSGTHPSISFPELGVAAPANTVFFEEFDPN
jgi:hypothetical protein